MGRGIFRLFAFLSVFLAFSVTAQAQQIEPLNVEPDANGVDMLSGKISRSVPVLEIAAAPRLRLERLQLMLPVLTGSIHFDGNIYQGSFQLNTGGGTSESFQCIDDGCWPKSKSGSTLSHNGSANPSPVYNFMQGGTGMRITYSSLGNYSFNGDVRAFSLYPSTVSYPDGEVLTFTYYKVVGGSGTKHRPTKVVSSLGYQMQLTYQSANINVYQWGSLAQATIYRSADLTTPLARHTYGINGSITDLAGRMWSCCSDTLDEPTWISATTQRLPGESMNSITATVSTQDNRWVGQVVSDGMTWNYSYVATTHPYHCGVDKCEVTQATVTGPGGYQRVVVNDVPASPHEAAVVTSMTNALNQTTSYAYDSERRLNKITAPLGNSVSVTYDAHGNITERRERPTSGADLVQTANYTVPGTPGPNTPGCVNVTCFRPNWTRDAAGNQTDYTWAIHGGMLTKLEPADRHGKRRKTIYEYSTTGGHIRLIRERTCSILANGANDTCGTATELVKEYTYWGNTFLPLTEKMTNGTNSLASVTTYAYDNAGRVLSVDGPLAGTGDKVYNRYDDVGRKTWEIGPQGTSGTDRKATLTTYRDADDQPLKVETGTVSDPITSTSLTAPIQTVDHSYDSKRLRTKSVVKGGSSTPYGVTQMSYNARNQLECSAVRMNPGQFNSLPASACSLGAEGAMGKDRITKNTYDVLGRVTKTVGGYGVLNGGAGNVEIELGYTANGQISWRKDGNGNKTGYAYDGYDRNNYIYYPHKTSVGNYNTADRDYFTYDSRGNVLWHYRRDNRRIYHDIDNAGRLWRKRYHSGSAWLSGEYIYYGYDGLGRPTYERLASDGGQGLTHAYDGLSRLASTTDTTNGGSRTLSYQYDIAGRRTRVTHPDGVYFTYDFSPAGQVTAVKQYASTNLVTYSYDGLGRPTGINRANGKNTTLSYDPVSRPSSYNHVGLLNTTFAYSPSSQIISRTLSNDVYAWGEDVNVNRNYTTNGLNQYTAAGPASFTYDGNGNLTSDGSNSFAYDIENRLITKSGGTSVSYDPKGRLSQIAATSGTTRFLYDGDELALEYASNGTTILRRYVHGAEVDDPLVWYEGAGLTDKRFLIADERGSIINTSNASGSTIQINAYDDWGIPSATNLGRFQYTGQIWLPELGVYYYKARLYSPTLGRFMQTDPIGYEDGMNMYAYVGNDPMNGRDPTGLAVSSVPSCATRIGCASVVLDTTGTNGAAQGTQNAAAQNSNGNSSSGEGQGTGIQLGEDKPISNRDQLYRDTIPGATGGQEAAKAFAEGEYLEAAGQLLSGMAEAAMSVLLPQTRISKPVAGIISGYTRHGLNQAISREGRGVASRAILDAVRNPVRVVQQSGGVRKFVGKNATVVINKSGKVITTYAKSGGTRVP